MPLAIQQYILNQSHRDKLLALGFETIEEFQSAAQVASQEFHQFLGAHPDEILASIPVALEAIPQSAIDLIQSTPFSLGVDIDRIPRLSFATTFELPAPAATTACPNLVASMPPIRNQQNRGTCVAHAALAAMEHWLGTLGSQNDMSEQFLYWNCKSNDNSPNSPGTWLGIAFPLLQRDGCCLESDWPYNPNLIPLNESQAPPPPGSQAKALAFRIPGLRTIAPTSVPDIRNELANNRAVAFSVPVFNSWLRSNGVAFSGNITLPVPGEVRAGGHAMCIVGCIETPSLPALGGGRFIIRNSWGQNWGMNSPHGAGYGTIPFSYIARFGSEAYAVG